MRILRRPAPVEAVEAEPKTTDKPAAAPKKGRAKKAE